MIKLLDLLKENSSSTYNFGCVMLYFTFPEIGKIHSIINPEDVYKEDGDKTFGLEDEPHTTLLYGLHEEVGLDKIKNTLKDFTYSNCDIHNPSLFENEKYDVLKFDVKGQNLHETNSKLKQFPFTSNFPDYHPHLTIGYLKPGKGKKYVDILNNKKINNFQLIPEYAVYSQPNGDKNKIKIKVK